MNLKKFFKILLKNLLKEFIKDLKNIEKEEYYCSACGKRISKNTYQKYNGLCKHCFGAPTQQGFPKPPGFPRI